MRSIATSGIELRSTKERVPSSGAAYEAARWPSISTRVAWAVRPRSATAEEPAAKPLVNAVGIEPLLLADTAWITSETLV